MKGRVYIVGAGPGDPELITLKGVSALAKAEIVLYDRLIDPSLLEHAPNAEHIYVGKRSRHTPFNEQERIESLMVSYARMGKIVVRLKGGDPFVFGRGAEEALALISAKIPFEVIPGVSASYAVPGSAGIPLTHRGVASSFAVFSGHQAHDASDGGIDWELAAAVPTAVFLMGVGRLSKIVSALIKHGRSPTTPVAIIEKGTTKEEKTYTATLATIVERAQGVQPPATLIVGEVVGIGMMLTSGGVPLGDQLPFQAMDTPRSEIATS